MTNIPCFYCGDAVWVSSEAELETAICEPCVLELYGIDEDVPADEEVFV